MSHVVVQMAIVAAGGTMLAGLVLFLSRREKLSLRYALGWLAVSGLVVVGAVALAIAGGISNRLPFTPTGLLAAAGFAFLLLVSLQLSISLSGHQEAIRGIAETVAALEERVARAERESHRQPDQSSQS